MVPILNMLINERNEIIHILVHIEYTENFVPFKPNDKYFEVISLSKCRELLKIN